MSEQSGVACPRCGRSYMVGRVELRERCIDLETGEVVRDEAIAQVARYECGCCGAEWKPAALSALSPAPAGEA